MQIYNFMWEVASSHLECFAALNLRIGLAFQLFLKLNGKWKVSDNFDMICEQWASLGSNANEYDDEMWHELPEHHRWPLQFRFLRVMVRFSWPCQTVNYISVAIRNLIAHPLGCIELIGFINGTLNSISIDFRLTNHGLRLFEFTLTLLTPICPYILRTFRIPSDSRILWVSLRYSALGVRRMFTADFVSLEIR